MSVLANDKPVDALPSRDAGPVNPWFTVTGCEKLKGIIPRHMFNIPIQAVIGGKVTAHETLSALRKDVTAKCYGGGTTRKGKLLDEQKACKGKMRQFRKVDILQEAFVTTLRMDGKMLEPFTEPRSERLYVKSFFSIKEIDLYLGQISVIIGPQASGKSILAKALFFLREYIEDMFFSIVNMDSDIDELNDVKVDDFRKLFPGIESENGVFRIKYWFGNEFVSIDRPSKKSAPRIRISDGIKRRFEESKSDYRHWVGNQSDKDIRRREVPSIYSYQRSSACVRLFWSSLPLSLYVPASRSFFTTIERNIFSLLSERDGLDPLMIQFGRFFEFGRDIFFADVEESDQSASDEWMQIANEILCGEYTKNKLGEFITMHWGKVRLSDASSGQQEVLPLLMALLLYPSIRISSDKLIVIEEPEAHLFPQAQKLLLELIVNVSIATGCKILLTTHSPYLLACLNNELVRPSKSDSRLTVSSHYIHAGIAEDIMDPEDGIIDMGAIDKVSEDIASEFMEFL